MRCSSIQVKEKSFLVDHLNNVFLIRLKIPQNEGKSGGIVAMTTIMWRKIKRQNKLVRQK